METKIIAGFPGVGKSFFVEKNPCCLDSDSSTYTWFVGEDGEKVRNPHFPENYITHIKENIGKVPVIFVSTHKEIRDALAENEIPFALVYPDLDLKEEYLDRYRERKSPESLINVIRDNWDKWITELQEAPNCSYSLPSGKFLDLGVVMWLDD